MFFGQGELLFSTIYFGAYLPGHIENVSSPVMTKTSYSKDQMKYETNIISAYQLRYEDIF